MRAPLSVLDIVPVPSGSDATGALRNGIALARHAEALGLARYWVAEHHNTSAIACTAPEVFLARVGAETSRIRIGSGGMMLPNHAPLKVAETFRMLEALTPGRVDLGLGRAAGTDPRTARSLRRGARATADDFPEQLGDLLGLLGRGLPVGHDLERTSAGMPGVSAPPIWVLGSSDASAQLAASLGLGFAYAHHLNPEDAIPALRAYRAAFEPSREAGGHAAPHAILAVSAICADTAREADDLASSGDLLWLRFGRGERHAPLPSVAEARAYSYDDTDRIIIEGVRARHLVGDTASVRARIDALVDASGADEVMVVCAVHDLAARKRVYDVLAAR